MVKKSKKGAGDTVSLTFTLLKLLSKEWRTILYIEMLLRISSDETSVPMNIVFELLGWK